MNCLDLSREQSAQMISRYEQVHCVKLDQILRCAANTGQVNKFFSDLHDALTQDRTISNLDGYGQRLYATSKRYPLKGDQSE